MKQSTVAVIVERDALAKALGTAARAVDPRHTVPIVTSVLLRTGAGTLTVTGTDLDKIASATVPAEAREGALNLCITADRLRALVNGLPPGSQVTLEALDGGKKLRVKAGRARYDLHTLPAEDFPAFEDIADPVRFTLPATALVDAFKTVQYAISRDKARHYLQGICLHPDDDGLRVVATDGMNLGMVVLAMPKGAEKLPEIIVHGDTIAVILHLIGDHDGDIEIEASDRKIGLALPNARLISKLVDGTFPSSYRQILAGEPKERAARVDVDELAAALTRLHSAGESNRLAVKIEAGTATLEKFDANAGQAEETIGCELTGEPIELPLSLASLSKIADAIGSDVAAIALSDAKSPMFVRPVTNGQIDRSRVFLAAAMEK